jgi:lambda family phage portal protein
MSFLKNLFNKTNVKKRTYEAGSRSKRTSLWLTSNGDANAETKGKLGTIRDRSRYLRRNSPYARKIVDVITNNVIGKGIQTEVKPDSVERFFDAWAKSTDIDFDGQHNLKGLQRIIMDAIVESGEVLIRRRITPELDVPIQYQILESDFIDSSLLNQTRANGNYIIQGIEFNSIGKIVGYWIYETHPGSVDRFTNKLISNFISADEIIHLYRKDRPGQIRGVPWMAPVIMKIKDLDDYEDAQLMKQKVAACFTGFVHDIDGQIECEDESTISDQEKLIPGLIEHLPPGKTITFSNPPQNDNYREFVSSHQREIAIGVGISYEALTGDLSEVNFSSARMGWIEMGRNIDSWREHLMMNGFLKRVEKDFKYGMALKGRNADSSEFTHIPPKREMIDPLKEVEASVKLVRAGFESRSNVISSMGKDPESVDKSIKEDLTKADQEGFVFDTDPRRVNETGRSHPNEVVNEQD